MFFSAVNLLAAWLSGAFILTLYDVVKRVAFAFHLTYCRHLVLALLTFLEFLLDNAICVRFDFLCLTRKQEQELTLKVSRNDVDVVVNVVGDWIIIRFLLFVGKFSPDLKNEKL